MSSEISLETIISRRQDDLVTSELSENELVMLSVERSSYYGLEETAKAIWDDLNEPRSISFLVDHLLTRFAVDRETCQREVLAFVNEMLQDKLVQVVDGTA